MKKSANKAAIATNGTSFWRVVFLLGQIQWDAIQFDAIKSGAILLGQIQWDAIQFDAIKSGAILFGQIQWDAIIFDAIEWGQI